jgi:WD40 repeat protein/serine/threonine protein kinase/tetratricopeptide (TPR) repeat protein
VPNDPARAKSLFLAASDLADPAARSAYLDRECRGDADLRARVEALLQADVAAPPPGPSGAAGTGAFASEAPATGTFAPDAPSAAPTADYPGRDEKAGAVVGGKYTLVEPIGEGGMGSVWRAKQTEPVKRFVALKLIKAGMDSRQVLARFEAERQALALMDHPNIAKVLDAGATPDGRPYFVMELVKGVPITEYCDARRLTPKERLELFVPVCQAIQHAHQKGVIHRDIKPSNVLIALYDDKPVVKVIDFGVAKATGGALTERTIDTGFGGVDGTPEYMSPEQATFNNLDIDTRSDVYALGVLLYELLAGSPPFARKELEKKGLLEMLRVVREDEPPRPSTKLSTAEALPSLSADRGTEPRKLTGLLRNELDWIVMKALEKDRARRYETANAFAADVQRYLGGEAVHAHPPSAGYRLKKFVRRHKGRVVAASLVLFALLGGIAGTTLGLIEARRQEQEAKTQEQEAKTQEQEAKRQEQIARDESAEKEKARAAAAERVKERDAALKAEAERADELKHRLGTSAMVLANAAFDSRDFKLTAERLDAVPAGQRGWEWHYLKRQLRGGIFTLYCGAVSSVAFSSDGTRIVTGGGGGEGEPYSAKVWDARTGAHLFNVNVPQGEGGVRVVAFSPDCTRILTCGDESKARVRDAATGKILLELNEQSLRMTCAAFSPDGTRIATASEGGAVVVRVWDARTGESVCHWRAPRVARLAFSPDGARLLTSGLEGAVKVWDAKTGTILLDAKGLMSSGNSVAFSPDGTRLVAGRDDGTARVIDSRTGESLLVLRGRPRVWQMYMSPPYGVLSVAFSPDGTRIVTAGTSDGSYSGEASVWDARTGVELLELKGHTAPVVSASFSPDGQRVITGSNDGTAKVWDVRTGTPRLELAEFNSPVECAAMSADGRWIVTGGGQYEQLGEATVWDAQTGLPKFALKGLKGIGPVHAVAISRDGTRIVTAGGTAGGIFAPRDAVPVDAKAPGPRPEVVVWDARTGKALFELKGLKETVGSVSISPDGTRIVTAGFLEMGAGGSAGSELKVWDATSGTLLHELTPPGRQRGVLLGERGGSVAFSPDGKRFVTGGLQVAKTRVIGEVKVWDAITGKPLVTMKGNELPVLSVAFSPDGTRIATASDDKTATVWDAATGAVLVELKGHTGSVNSVAFSPDGTRLVTGSNDRTVRVWDARTGTTLAELKSLTDAVTSVSFSADGSQLLASAGRSKPGEIVVWDAPTHTPEVELAGYTGIIRTAVFSPDGTQVVTVSQDGTVRLWDARTGTTIRELKGAHPGAHLVAVSADGTRIACGGTWLKVWDARTGTELIAFNTGSIRSMAFAVDGTRIVTDASVGPHFVFTDESVNQLKKLWDARTGTELKGEAIPKTVRSEGTSPDGRFSVRLRAGRAEVVPLATDPKEIAYLLRNTQPNPSRYRTGYRAARVAKDDFAAAFYLNLVPAAERKAVVEQGDADVFAALNVLAQEHQQAGKLDEAIPLLVEILKVNRAKFGLENPATIETTNTLIDIYFRTGQGGKAIPVLEEWVKVLKAKQHPDTHHMLGQLARAYKDAGLFKEAIVVFEEVVAKEASARPQLLDVYALAGEHAKIVTVCREQLEHLRTAKDEGQLANDRADLMARLGSAFLAQKKWTDAETQFRECVTLGEKNWPQGSFLYDTQSLLGEALLRQKKYAEAEPLLLKGYESLKKMEYSLTQWEAIRLPESLDRLIEFYTVTNKPDEVKKWRAERAKYPTPKAVAPPPRERK